MRFLPTEYKGVGNGMELFEEVDSSESGGVASRCSVAAAVEDLIALMTS